MSEKPWFRVEVSDRDGQIVAIESEMLAGRDIGDTERETICRAIDHLAGFVGLPAACAAELAAEREAHAKTNEGLAWFAECVIRERNGTPDPQGWIQRAFAMATERRQELQQERAARERAEADNLRLRKIAAHVPARDYIKAKEAAGFGIVIRAALAQQEEKR